jgi:hypothetical protein
LFDPGGVARRVPIEGSIVTCPSRDRRCQRRRNVPRRLAQHEHVQLGSNAAGPTPG